VAFLRIGGEKQCFFSLLKIITFLLITFESEKWQFATRKVIFLLKGGIYFTRMSRAFALNRERMFFLKVVL